MKRQVSTGFEPVLAVGLMSGTSLDGVDAVLLETDGEGHVSLKGQAYVAYPADIRARAKAAASGDVPLDEVLRLERDLSALYVQAVRALNVDAKDVAVVGCHGQTIRHLPDEGLTWQLANPNHLAAALGIPVVTDFRRRDMALGGQGAPLVPLYHQALVGEGKGLVLVNLGGVSNATWFDEQGAISASDCGPGMGLMDLYMQGLGQDFDKDGALAAQGTQNDEVMEKVIKLHPFFRKPLPRSAHRHEFDDILREVEGMQPADAMATLCVITLAAVLKTIKQMGVPPGTPLVMLGGGANNTRLMRWFEESGTPVVKAEDMGLRPQTMEAEAFAWLAVRRLRNLPFSIPATTGCKAASVGGTLTA